VNVWWLVGGALVVGGIVVYAGRAAARTGGCEVTEEWVSPYMMAAILFRKCTEANGDGTYRERVLWDVALLEDVTIGPDFQAERWPAESLYTGQANNEDAAVGEAMAWIDANVGFVASGGARGPLALRVEEFLAGLSPAQVDELRAIFAFEGTAVSDAWPYVEQLRTAATDETFMELGQQLGNKLALLTDAERSAMERGILSAVGFGGGLTLRGILQDAGVS